MANKKTREDAYPSHKSSPDQGCEFAPSCLNCPFPKCVLDEPRGIASAKKRDRDEEILQRFLKGEGISDLVKAFGVCHATIYRAVKKCGGDD